MIRLIFPRGRRIAEAPFRRSDVRETGGFTVPTEKGTSTCTRMEEEPSLAARQAASGTVAKASVDMGLVLVVSVFLGSAGFEKAIKDPVARVQPESGFSTPRPKLLCALAEIRAAISPASFRETRYP